MTDKFILSLWHYDKSGVIQTFGPYDTEEEAVQVRDRLSKWPSISGSGYLSSWTIEPVVSTSGSPGQDLRDSEVPSGWTADLAANYRTRFTNGEACKHCGGIHARACPRIKKMNFHSNGSLAEVEFWSDGQWSDDNVVWPEEIPEFPEETQ